MWAVGEPLDLAGALVRLEGVPPAATGDSAFVAGGVGGGGISVVGVDSALSFADSGSDAFQRCR